MKYQVRDKVKFPDDPAVGQIVAICFVPASPKVAVRWPGMQPYTWTWHAEDELEMVEERSE